MHIRGVTELISLTPALTHAAFSARACRHLRGAHTSTPTFPLSARSPLLLRLEAKGECGAELPLQLTAPQSAWILGSSSTAKGGALALGSLFWPVRARAPARASSTGLLLHPPSAGARTFHRPHPASDGALTGGAAAGGLHPKTLGGTGAARPGRLAPRFSDGLAPLYISSQANKLCNSVRTARQSPPPLRHGGEEGWRRPPSSPSARRTPPVARRQLTPPPAAA